jgi:hypothetical protein
MADSVNITNLPDAGSREAVAFKMAQWIWDCEWAEGRNFDRKLFLQLYVDCMGATIRQMPKQ